jgi:hypothetical protein
MRFLLLIKHDEAEWLAKSDADKEQIYAEYRALLADLGRSGHLVEADQCMSSDSAKSVGVVGGEVTLEPVSNDAREQVAGFILVETESREDAIRISARIPSARGGRIEIWPLSPRQHAN